MILIKVPCVLDSAKIYRLGTPSKFSRSCHAALHEPTYAYVACCDKRVIELAGTVGSGRYRVGKDMISEDQQDLSSDSYSSSS